MYIAQKLGYISVVEVLKNVTKPDKGKNTVVGSNEDKYKVVAPETMQENFMSDSEDEGGKYLEYSIILLLWLRLSLEISDSLRSEPIICV